MSSAKIAKMKAIILAAGPSWRMYSLAQDKPKCLLPISGQENILDRQIRILKQSGVSDITVVVAFRHKKSFDDYEDQVSIFHPPHDGLGSAYSLWSARERFDDDLLIVNSDVIFNQKIIKDLIKNRNVYCFVVSRKKCDREDQKVRVENRLIAEVGKYILSEEAYGEFIGLAKVAKRGIKKFQEALDQAIKDNPYLFYAEVFNYLIKRGTRLHFIKTTTPWIEVDTPKDYQRAKEMLRLNYLD